MNSVLIIGVARMKGGGALGAVGPFLPVSLTTLCVPVLELVE